MRRRRATRRDIPLDPLYGSAVVEKFVNQVMRKGKKTTARKIVYTALDIVGRQSKDDPVKIFDKAIENAAPLLEVKSRRIGGATYQVPREVRGDRRMALAMRWLIGAAKVRKGMPMAKKLAEELSLAAKNEGGAVKKKTDTHRMAEANKAFAHFSW